LQPPLTIDRQYFLKTHHLVKSHSRIIASLYIYYCSVENVRKIEHNRGNVGEHFFSIPVIGNNPIINFVIHFIPVTQRKFVNMNRAGAGKRKHNTPKKKND